MERVNGWGVAAVHELAPIYRGNREEHKILYVEFLQLRLMQNAQMATLQDN